MVSALVNRFAEEPKSAPLKKNDPCEEQMGMRKNTVSFYYITWDTVLFNC